MRLIIILLFISSSCFSQNNAGMFFAANTKNSDLYKAKIGRYITLTQNQISAIDTLFAMLEGKVQIGTITNTKNLLAIYRGARFLTIWGNANANSQSLPPYDFSMTYYNSPTHASDGVAWNGTNQYATINVKPDTFNVSGTTLEYYSQTNVTSNSQIDMGIANSTATQLYSMGVGFAGVNRTQQYSSSPVVSATATFGSGMFISNTSVALGTLTLFGRDNSLASSTRAGSPFNIAGYDKLAVGCLYFDGTGNILYSTHKMAYCGIGDGFDNNTDAIQYSKIINYFMTKLEINAY